MPDNLNISNKMNPNQNQNPDLRSYSKRLRWGVLSTGNIAKKFIQEALEENIPIAAVASRDLEKAKNFIQQFGATDQVIQAYGSYEELLLDKNVDAVYIAPPHPFHAEWSIRAAQAGKHILCEKPATLDEAELQSVLEAVKLADVFFMEAFMYRLHPLWDKVFQLIAENKIGSVQSLHSSFCFALGDKPDNIRLQEEVRGGALFDIGCYGLNFSRMLAQQEPSHFKAKSKFAANSQVDEITEVELEFPNGIKAYFKCAVQFYEHVFARIEGSLGTIEITNPWHPSKDQGEIRLILPGENPEIIFIGDGIESLAREALVVARDVDHKQSSALTWKDSLEQARWLAKIWDAVQ